MHPTPTTAGHSRDIALSCSLRIGRRMLTITPSLFPYKLRLLLLRSSNSVLAAVFPFLTPNLRSPDYLIEITWCPIDTNRPNRSPSVVLNNLGNILHPKQEDFLLCRYFKRKVASVSSCHVLRRTVLLPRPTTLIRVFGLASGRQLNRCPELS